jgi:hypothetical protein
MINRIDNALKKLEKYYTHFEDSPYYVMAIILCPSRRTKWILDNWAADRAQKAVRFAKYLWEKHRDKPLLYATAIEEQLQIEQKHRTKKDREKKASSQNPFERIKEQRNQSSRPKSHDEYEDFNMEVSYDPGIAPLEWWLQDVQRKRWPRLSLLAIEIFTIPAMSDEPERIFSGGRRTMRWDRAKLSIETLEMLECQKHWMKQQFPIDIIG